MVQPTMSSHLGIILDLNLIVCFLDQLMQIYNKEILPEANHKKELGQMELLVIRLKCSFNRIVIRIAIESNP